MGRHPGDLNDNLLGIVLELDRAMDVGLSRDANQLTNSLSRPNAPLTATALVRSGSIQSSISNLTLFAKHLKAANPRRFAEADPSPCTSGPVTLTMRAISRRYASTVTDPQEDFLNGSSIFGSYGREVRRRMLCSVLEQEDTSETP